MSYREVTKDDVGKVIECRDTLNGQWQQGWILNSFVPQRGETMVIAETEERDDWTYFAYARIRTSPLPDGWLPDDWRVLGDEEVCKLGDRLLFNQCVDEKFSLEESLFDMKVNDGYEGKTAGYLSSRLPHHLCVIRPRWRTATKDDVGKHALSIHYVVPFPLVSIFEPDQYGIDCALRHKCGYRFDRLKDLKVENEGWNVTN